MKRFILDLLIVVTKLNNMFLSLDYGNSVTIARFCDSHAVNGFRITTRHLISHG